MALQERRTARAAQRAVDASGIESHEEATANALESLSFASMSSGSHDSGTGVNGAKLHSRGAGSSRELAAHTRAPVPPVAEESKVAAHASARKSSTAVAAHTTPEEDGGKGPPPDKRSAGSSGSRRMNISSDGGRTSSVSMSSNGTGMAATSSNGATAVAPSDNGANSSPSGDNGASNAGNSNGAAASSTGGESAASQTSKSTEASGAWSNVMDRMRTNIYGSNGSSSQNSVGSSSRSNSRPTSTSASSNKTSRNSSNGAGQSQSQAKHSGPASQFQGSVHSSGPAIQFEREYDDEGRWVGDKPDHGFAASSDAMDDEPAWIKHQAPGGKPGDDDDNLNFFDSIMAAGSRLISGSGASTSGQSREVQPGTTSLPTLFGFQYANWFRHGCRNGTIAGCVVYPRIGASLQV